MPSDVKPSTGVAFDLYFKEPSKDAIKSPVQSPPKPCSAEEIQKKLDAAEERRKAAIQEVKDKIAKQKEEEDKVKARKEKAQLEALEKLKEKEQKVMSIKQAQEEARLQKLKIMTEKFDKVRAKKKEIGDTDEPCVAADMTRAQ